MKRIVTYQVFESEKNGLTPEQEAFLNECTTGQWKFDSLTGLVNVVGDFNCSAKGLKDFKNVNFGKITGDFLCPDNKLTSLTGAPQTVAGNFDCHDSSLTSLTGAPQTVGGDFVCIFNNLNSLKGAPQSVDGGFFCSETELESLIGAPQTVGGVFDCHDNNLSSLTGAPQTVGGVFDCYTNNLSSLEGSPQKVGGGFYCFDNQLRTLEGAPQTVAGGFFCSENKLESLIGAPQTVGGDFVCNEFVLGRDQWNPVGWMEIFVGESQEARELILSLLTPDILNKEIEKDPQGMIQVLKPVWGLRKFAKLQKELKFPDEYGDVGQTIRSMNKLDSMKDFI